MTLKDRLNEDLKLAMKARNTRRVSTLRLAMAAIKDQEIRPDAPRIEIESVYVHTGNTWRETLLQPYA